MTPLKIFYHISPQELRFTLKKEAASSSETVVPLYQKHVVIFRKILSQFILTIKEGVRICVGDIVSVHKILEEKSLV
jgi:hypothetical protein